MALELAADWSKSAEAWTAVSAEGEAVLKYIGSLNADPIGRNDSDG